MKSYFDSQMRVLQEDVNIFAKQYPEHARYLNIESIDDKDPNVERLLEGFAYLTGRIQQKLDQGLIGLSETLLENLSPNALMATPSKAIAKFDFDLTTKREGHFTVSPKILLSSEKVGEEKTACKFCVGMEETLYPIALKEISQEETNNYLYEIKLSFQVDDLAMNFSMSSLKIYFEGEMDFRLSWLYTVLETQKNTSLLVKGIKYPIGVRHPYLDETSIKSNDPFAIETLKDFFVFNDKFMFVELINLPDLTFSASETFDIVFLVNEALPYSSINKDNILLGCMPIVNSYPYSAEPVNHTGDEVSSPVLIDASRRQSVCLQEVQSVSAIKSEKSEYLTYIPFSHYGKNQQNSAFYRIERQPSVMGAHRIILSGDESTKAQTLSITVKASNAFYPRKYIVSRSLVIDPLLSISSLTATNITKPTKYFPSINQQQYYWRLIGILSENYQNLSERNNIIDLLHQHDLQDRYAKKIEAIMTTDIQLKQNFKKGVLYQGLLYSIEIDDALFTSKHEIYLFGLLLHFVLLHHVEINHFLTTKVYLSHQSDIFEWQADQGKVKRS